MRTAQPGNLGGLGRLVERLLLPAGINIWPRKIPNPLSGNALSSEDVFDQVFNDRYWVSHESPDSSASGPGSSRAYTNDYAQRLLALLERLGIDTVFDAPCGDLHWMAPLAEQSSWSYIGADISTSIIEHCKERYPAMDIRKMDITRDSFPRADLWHCRDCLFHLNFSDIHSALRNFARSGIQYALLTTHRSRFLHANLDIRTGEFRILDLERKPIALPTPIAYLRDYRYGRDFPRFMGLWERSQIQASLHDFSTN